MPELNKTTGLYDLPFRNYDASLGRFFQVDPMADKYSSQTPYNFAFNRPNVLTDVDGADPYRSPYMNWHRDENHEGLGFVNWNSVSEDMFGFTSSSFSGSFYVDPYTFINRALDGYGGYWSNGEANYYSSSEADRRVDRYRAAFNRAWRRSIKSNLTADCPTCPNGKEYDKYRDSKDYYEYYEGKVYAMVEYCLTCSEQKSESGNPDVAEVLKKAHILMAHMVFNTPDAVSFSGGADLGVLVGGTFQKGKIYGLRGSIKGQSTFFIDSGLGYNLGGAVSLNVTEYYFINLSGKDYDLEMDDFGGERVSINASVSVWISLGFGLSISPITSWDSGLYIISKNTAYGLGIEGHIINLNYGQSTTYK